MNQLENRQHKAECEWYVVSLRKVEKHECNRFAIFAHLNLNDFKRWFVIWGIMKNMFKNQTWRHSCSWRHTLMTHQNVRDVTHLWHIRVTSHRFFIRLTWHTFLINFNLFLVWTQNSTIGCKTLNLIYPNKYLSRHIFPQLPLQAQMY